ncbi:MAG TPA: glycosyltransferase family 4 protein [Candidatus Saccharimonadales bacterium]|nr:glycosyltransferase family 4 protein [Candidatus Saccharimonadales bacterium]
MKIGLVLDDTLDTPDGVQQYVLRVGSWLAAHGHDVHYLVGHTTRRDVQNVHSLSRNLRVKFNGNRMSMPLPASPRRLKAFLAQQHFDILHVQVPYSPFLAGRLLRLAPAGTKVVGTFHVLPFGRVERLANRLLAAINRRTARRFSGMVAASPAAAAFAEAYYGFKTTVIPHPFSYKTFAVRAAIPTGQVTILYLGRLVERKGALWLLKAVAELHRQKRLPADARVVIGGKGPLLPKLQAYVHSQGLSKQVTFTGFVAEADKPAFLAQADIGVFPSISGESFGISIIEALAAVRGVVLAGNNPGYRAAMQLDDQLVDPKDTTTFANTLAYWLHMPKERVAAAKRQRQVAQQYDETAVCTQLLELYAKALQTRRKS